MTTHKKHKMWLCALQWGRCRNRDEKVSLRSTVSYPARWRASYGLTSESFLFNETSMLVLNMKRVLQPQGAWSLNWAAKNYDSILSCIYFVGGCDYVTVTRFKERCFWEMKCFAFLLRVLMRRLILIQLVASGEVIYGNRLNTPHLISPPHWPLKKQKKSLVCLLCSTVGT